MKRPLWTVGSTAAVVLLLMPFFPQWVCLTAAGVCLLAAGVLAGVFHFRKYLTTIAALLTAMAAIVVYGVADVWFVAPVTAHDGETVSLTMTVTGQESRYATVRVTAGDLPAGTRLMLYSAGSDSRFSVDEVIVGDVSLSVPDKTTMAVLSAKAKGIYLNAAPRGVLTYRKTVHPWYHFLTVWREDAAWRMAGLLSGDVLGTLCGICLGDRTVLSETVTAAFRTGGLSHLLVVSGLHLSVLAFALRYVLKKCHLPQPVVIAGSVAGVWLFAAFVGSGSSVVRAAVMMTVVLLADSLRRQSDGLNSLGLALLIATAGNPFVVFNSSLLLSFSATAGILVLFPRWQTTVNRYLPPPKDATLHRVRAFFGQCGRTIVGMMLVSVAATVAVFPVSAWLFGEVSLWGPFLSLPAIPLTQVILITGYAGVLLSLIPPFGLLAQGCLFVGGLAARLLLFLVRAVSAVPFGVLTLSEPYAYGILGLLVGLLAVGYALRRGKGLCVCAVVSVVALLLSAVIRQTGLSGVATVTVLSGGTDTVVLVEQDGFSAVCLSAKTPETVYGMQRLLSDHGIRRLDTLVVWDSACPVITGLPAACGSLLSGTALGYPAEETSCRYVLSAFAENASIGTEKHCVHDEITVQWTESFLYLRVGKTCLAVAPEDGGNCPSPTPDVLVFRGGETETLFPLPTAVWVQDNVKTEDMGLADNVRQHCYCQRIASGTTAAFWTCGDGICESKREAF